ncbi:MAG: hypothetical protein N2595_09945 [bacterium]|nr:hypothetical protein [bacterium]
MSTVRDRVAGASEERTFGKPGWRGWRTWVWTLVMVAVYSEVGEAIELTVLSPTNGMLVRGCEVTCTGESVGVEVVRWTNWWKGGGASGELVVGERWSFQVPCGFGTNNLLVIASNGGAGAVTAGVFFIADQSMIVITSQNPNFATNLVTFSIGGTGAYLKNIMWWNIYSSSNATGMMEGRDEWTVEVIGAAQGSNRFTVWGFSWYGVLSSDQRYYWVDSVAPRVEDLLPQDGSNVAAGVVVLCWRVSEAAVSTVYTNGALAGVGGEELVLSNVEAGVYYWFVRAIDGVGNVGYSETNRLIVPEVKALWIALLVGFFLLGREWEGVAHVERRGT